MQDFSKVLSQQQPLAGKGVASPPAASKSELADDKTPEPQDPDTTLALILNSAALPLMRPIGPVAVTSPQGDATNAAPRAVLPTQGPSATVLLPETLITTATPGTAQDSTAMPLDQPKDAQASHQATLPAQLTAAATMGKPGLHEPLPETIASPSQGQQAVAKGQATQAIVNAAQVAVQASATPASTRADATTATQGAPSGPELASAGFLAAPALSSPLATNPTVTLAVATPLSSPQWAQGFGQQILSIAQSNINGLHTVQLHVNPPELGPVHITLQIADSGTQAAFVSPHAHVRQALENAIPHLEQQFAQAGLSLGQANVSDQQAGQQGFNQSGFSGHGSGGGATFSLASAQTGVAAPTGLASVPPSRHPESLVDTFA